MSVELIGREVFQWLGIGMAVFASLGLLLLTAAVLLESFYRLSRNTKTFGTYLLQRQKFECWLADSDRRTAMRKDQGIIIVELEAMNDELQQEVEYLRNKIQLANPDAFVVTNELVKAGEDAS